MANRARQTWWWALAASALLHSVLLTFVLMSTTRESLSRWLRVPADSEAQQGDHAASSPPPASPLALKAPKAPSLSETLQAMPVVPTDRQTPKGDAQVPQAAMTPAAAISAASQPSAAQSAGTPSDAILTQTQFDAFVQQEQQRLSTLSPEQQVSRLSDHAAMVQGYDPAEVNKMIGVIHNLSGTSAAQRAREPLQPRQVSPGSLDMSTARYSDVAVKETAAGRVIVFTVMDQLGRTNTEAVPEAQLTPLQRSELNLLQRRQSDFNADQAVRARFFDPDSARYVSVDDTSTDPATGQRVYEFTLMDRMGHTLKHRVPQSQMEAHDWLQVRLLRMKAGNANFGAILEAASDIVEQRAGE